MNIPQHWRLNAQRYALKGACHSDGEVCFPPRPEVEQRARERYSFETDVKTAVPAEMITRQEPVKAQLVA
jgi:hypothetical protein